MSESTQNELERRIVRALDGELSASQRADLDRELLRNPEARSLMEAYRQIDRQTASALRAAFGPRGAALSVGATARPTSPPGTLRWMPIGLAAAAMALLAVGVGMLIYGAPWQPGGAAPGPGPLAVGREGAGAAETSPAVAVARGARLGSHDAGPDVPLMYDMADPSPMFDAPRRGDRIIDRRFFGVFDESKRELYLIEVDRVRTRIDTVSLDL